MFAQDTVTGELHEVPDYQIYGTPYGAEVLDGLGNPVGEFDFLKNLVSNIPIVGPLVSGLLPGGSPAAPTPPAALPVVPPPPFPQLPFGGQPFPQPFSPFLPPTPPGWMQPAFPYTGAQPRRVYMRCSVWPGQPGLVPTAPGAWPQPVPP